MIIVRASEAVQLLTAALMVLLRVGIGLKHNPIERSRLPGNRSNRSWPSGCFACHGPDKAEGGLRLNRKESAFAELESGNRALGTNGSVET